MPEPEQTTEYILLMSRRQLGYREYIWEDIEAFSWEGAVAEAKKQIGYRLEAEEDIVEARLISVGSNTYDIPEELLDV